jgi:DNA gyrase subunit B
MEAGLLAALNKERRYDPAEGYSWRDIASGIRAAVSVRHPDPQFESPTKVLLMNPEIFGAVAGLAYSAFSAYLSKLDLQERQQLWDKIDGS